jgi:putative transposon-encoded protein
MTADHPSTVVFDTTVAAAGNNTGIEVPAEAVAASTSR